MALEAHITTPANLVDNVQALSLSEPDLSDPECLSFRPTAEKESLPEKFDIPRFLFRVFTPKSRGTTDLSWAKSMDARCCSAKHDVDIFSRDDDAEVARMIYRHLRWWKSSEDNLVSWTSSLLFALVYIFHLHANPKYESSFEDISLCVVDTTRFPEGAFLRDMDLIRAYRSFNTDLMGFEGFRSNEKKFNESRSYYFGEYLSQGALEIENRCQIVSAQAMIDRGLYELRPEFKSFANWERTTVPPWANEVIGLRGVFYEGATQRQAINEEEVDAAVKIATLFGGQWRLPVAANFIALRPRLKEDIGILQAFELPPFTDHDREDCSPKKTRVVAFDTLPEVQQFDEIMQIVFTDFCLTKIGSDIREAESRLRSAMDQWLNIGDSTAWGQDIMSINPNYSAVLQRLGAITDLSQSVRQEMIR